MTESTELVDMEPYELSRDELVGQATEMTVETDEQYRTGEGLRKLLVELRKEILSHLQPNIDAWHKGHKASTTQKNNLVNPIDGAVKAIGLTMGDYNQRQKALQDAKDSEAKREREAIEEAALEKAQAMQDAGKPEEAAAVMEAVPRVPVTVEQVAAPRMSGGRDITNWKFEIEDPNLLPREYLIPDMATIGRVVRSSKGEIAIPGVRMWSVSKRTG